MNEEMFCKNCKRFIPSETLTLHSAHCERFIQVCLKCQEPIPKSQKEQHDIEVHSIIDCKDCHQQLEKCAEQDHFANQCTKRLVTCEFCEIECIATNLEDHKLLCGSRTEICLECRNHVLVRMLKLHEELHKTDICYSEHTATVDIPSSNKIPNGPMGKMKPPISKTDVNQAQPIPELPKFRNVVCQNILQAAAVLPTQQLPVAENEALLKKSTNLDPNAGCPLIPCEFCGIPCTVACLAEHQLCCDSNMETCYDCQEKVLFGQLSSHVCPTRTSSDTILSATYSRNNRVELDEGEYWSRYTITALKDDEDPDEDEACIPCEICGILFPVSCVELHEIACKFADLSTQATMKVSQEEYFRENKLLRSEPTYLPCSFCNIAISSSILEMHEAGCNRFSEQKSRPLATTQFTSNKVVGRNPRPENASQRSLRENTLSATEHRLATTPKIQQSQYTVRQLPDGREILKKRNSGFNINELDVGQVLGRSHQHHRMDYGPSVIPPSSYGVNHLDGHNVMNVGQKNGEKGVDKSLFNQCDSTKPLVSTVCTRNDYSSGIARQTYSTQKNNVSTKPSSERNLEMRITKKPNAAFSNYAYQPDPGNKLGGGNIVVNDRSSQAKNKGAIPRPPSSIRAEIWMNGQQNQQDEMRDSQHSPRNHTHNRETFLGAKPKHPSQSRENF